MSKHSWMLARTKWLGVADVPGIPSSSDLAIYIVPSPLLKWNPCSPVPWLHKSYEYGYIRQYRCRSRLSSTAQASHRLSTLGMVDWKHPGTESQNPSAIGSGLRTRSVKATCVRCSRTARRTLKSVSWAAISSSLPGLSRTLKTSDRWLELH